MKLKTENPKNGLKAIIAFFEQKGIKRLKKKEYDYTFEHGQLWITHIDGAQWSVEDAEGPGTINGFDFEQVSFEI